MSTPWYITIQNPALCQLGAAAHDPHTLTASLLGEKLLSTLFYGFDDKFFFLTSCPINSPAKFLLPSLPYLYPATQPNGSTDLFRGAESLCHGHYGKKAQDGQTKDQTDGLGGVRSSFTERRRHGSGTVNNKALESNRFELNSSSVIPGYRILDKLLIPSLCFLTCKTGKIPATYY